MPMPSKSRGPASNPECAKTPTRFRELPPPCSTQQRLSPQAPPLSPERKCPSFFLGFSLASSGRLESVFSAFLLGLSGLAPNFALLAWTQAPPPQAHLVGQACLKREVSATLGSVADGVTLGKSCLLGLFSYLH